MDELEIILQGDDTAGTSADEEPVLDLEDLSEYEDRYSRLRLIPWWDQQKLAQAKVLVVGAGALGNEILKNLALLGIGQIYVIDFDTIENSNLSRAILYRAKDEGKIKAEIAAAAVQEINPDCKVRWFNGDIAMDVGLGLFRRMDVVIGGLDNREARLAINQACWRVGTPWIDGAIEVVFGVARVFVPQETACYECTMSEQDYRLLNLRRSCALLSRDQMVTGKVPTTPTTSSVIAGIQVQEAVKLIHRRQDLPTLAGKGYFFNGLTHDSYVVEYELKSSCPSHEFFGEITELPLKAATTSIKQMLEVIRIDLGPDAVLELGREIVVSLNCRCGYHLSVFKPLGKVTEQEGRCPECGKICGLEMTHSIKGTEPFLAMSLAEVGVPPLDIVSGRVGLTIKHYELTGDLSKLMLQ